MLVEVKPIMTVGDKIKQIRENLDYSQKELAKLIGVTQMALSKWERGERNPSRNNIKKLCEITNKPFKYFIEESDKDETTTIKLHYFAYYSHRDHEIYFSTKTKELNKKEYGLEDIEDMVAVNEYFIYELREDYPPYKAGGLILFQRIHNMSDIKDTDYLVLFTSGDLWRYDKGVFKSFEGEELKSVDDINPIAVSRQFISVQV
jgi:transcriptional regulator with XRE-family HTH domain